MRFLGTVIRVEWLIQVRNRGWWIAALFMVVFGIWMPSGIREAPWGAWGTMVTAAMLVTLILVFMTGDQVIRERERRVDGVIWSTPMQATPYVIGKYLATLGLLIGTSLLYLGSAVLMDHFDSWRNPPAILGHSVFPAFGPWPYITTWLWVFPIPLIFGSALMLAAMTLTHGQRIVAYAGALIIWIAPAFSMHWPELLDLPSANLQQIVPFAGSTAAFQLMINAQFPGQPGSIFAQQILHFAQSDFPLQAPLVYLWNRILFLGLAVLLLIVTIRSVERQRRDVESK